MSGDPFGMAIPEARLDRIIRGYLRSMFSILGKVRYHFVLVYPESDALQETKQAIIDGQIRPIIHQKFPLSEASVAHQLLEERHTKGKIILINNMHHTMDEATQSKHRGTNVCWYGD